jgi:glycosyltransferase involved in cell wall biosynthesis
MIGSDRVNPEYAARVRGAIATAGLRARIAVPGPLVDAALDREWYAADLFVLPSRIEMYGLVIGEALARGIPAVVTAGPARSRRFGKGGPARLSAVRSAQRQVARHSDRRR